MVWFWKKIRAKKSPFTVSPAERGVRTVYKWSRVNRSTKQTLIFVTGMDLLFYWVIAPAGVPVFTRAWPDPQVSLGNRPGCIHLSCPLKPICISGATSSPGKHCDAGYCFIFCRINTKSRWTVLMLFIFLSQYKKSNLPASRQAKEANRILDEIKKLKPVSPQAGLLRCAKMRA